MANDEWTYYDGPFSAERERKMREAFADLRANLARPMGVAPAVPRTDAERAALPVGPAFGYVLREIDGQMMKCPVMEQTCAFYVDDDVPMQWRDADGQHRTLGRYASGHWFKRRS